MFCRIQDQLYFYSLAMKIMKIKLRKKSISKASKKINYLGINIAKKWKTCTLKTIKLSKLTQRSNIIPTKFQLAFEEIDKLNLKFIQNCKEHRVTKQPEK